MRTFEDQAKASIPRLASGRLPCILDGDIAIFVMTLNYR